MRLYLPIAKVDAEQRMVFGYASTEARDDQGEIVRRDALTAALGDYMKFANIREMHQLSAVGTAKEASVDEHGLYVGAKIVDPLAWEKVVEGVYKGYSIGGKVTKRDPADYKTITGLSLDEISLVDRPANPEAVFDYWKAAAGGSTMADLESPQSTEPRSGGRDVGPFNPPIQIWACGDPSHRHLAKADASACIEKRAASGAASEQERIDAELAAIAAVVDAKAADDGKGDKPYGDVEYADPGYQSDGKKRYPIDTERHIRAAWNYINKPKNAGEYTAEQVARIKAKIVAAWKEKIDKDGPPSAKDSDKALRVEFARAVSAGMAKALWDAGRVADVIINLDWLQEALEVEAAMEGDASPQPERLKAIVAELCAFLNALVAEETAEILAGTEIDAPMETTVIVGLAAGAKGDGQMQKRSDGDQHLMDLGHAACDKALGMDGMTAKERGHMVQAREAFKAAGAGEPGGADEHSTTDTGRNAEHPAPTTGDADPTTSKAVLDAITAALGKRAKAHEHLMDVAHQCVKALTDGGVCADGASGKAAGRHSQETMDHLHKAHYHLVSAGAKCDAAGQFTAEGEHQGTQESTARAAVPDLTKAIRDIFGDQLAALTGKLDALSGRVEDIAKQPMPPAAVARLGTAAVEKGGGGYLAEVAATLDAMTPEQRALTFIKGALANPQRIRHPNGEG